MRVAILPSGALLADAPRGGDEAGDGLSGVARARVARAFGRGPGHALLDLGSTELDAPLVPPLAFLRDLGRAFVTRLCALPDLEEHRDRIEVDCPADERERLAVNVPPMDGSEYVDADWIAARWADLNRAFADEISAHRGSVGGWLSARHPSWHVVGKVCLHLAENRADEEHPFAFSEANIRIAAKEWLEQIRSGRAPWHAEAIAGLKALLADLNLRLGPAASPSSNKPAGGRRR